MFILLLPGKNGITDDFGTELRKVFRKYDDVQASLEVVHKFVVHGYGSSGFDGLAVRLTSNIGKWMAQQILKWRFIDCCNDDPSKPLSHSLSFSHANFY